MLQARISVHYICRSMKKKQEVTCVVYILLHMNDKFFKSMHYFGIEMVVGKKSIKYF